MCASDEKKAPITDHSQAAYYFHQGSSIRAYEYLGVHREGERTAFRVWAPNADAVWVCGDFNGWDPAAAPMKKITVGVWEAFLPSEDVVEGQNYKFRIQSGERYFFKADPFATRMQHPPETASVICSIDGYVWHDAGWMDYRRGRFCRGMAERQAINVYEVHLGSWRRHGDGGVLSYPEIARELAVYVKQMGYTHVELMPVSEFPFDGSWGYQVSGYYAPTSRFGEPREFMEFVDVLHEAGIGVILDWVPAHFPKDAHGLFEFDGRPLYEYQGADRMEQVSWGTRKFDVGREEVQSFLISNAVFWAENYHVDGLRVDAVASMLYLDYEKKPGEWIPNVYGENKCLEAIAFFQKLNSAMATNYPDVMTIAEESTAWGNVTSFSDGGLGFTMKWNMGWMNDALSYLEEDPLWRNDHHNKLTFSIAYAFGERYVLPISHDEVVHGKRSLLDRNPGPYEQKFAGLRTFLTYLMTHPGKKLTFMGCEIGQFREWDFAGQIEWFLLDYDMHAATQLFVAELNRFYLEHPALWERDATADGFVWIDADNREQSIYSYRRIDETGKELIVILNFLPIRRNDFLLAVPTQGEYEEIFNTDRVRYGGEGACNEGTYFTEECMLRGYSRAIRITVPSMGAAVFRRKTASAGKNAKRALPQSRTKTESAHQIQ